MRASNFTLVELLVVVAVIAILTSLLLPALGSAREMAKQIKCVGNLSQINKALLLYSSDWNCYGPAYDGGGAWHWPGKMGPYLNIPKFPAGGDYSRSTLVDCPALPSGSIVAWKCGYFINGEADYDGAYNVGALNTKPLTAATKPSALAMFICGDGQGYGFNRYYIRIGGFGMLHQGSKTCASYLDGHAGARKIAAGSSGDWSTDLVVPSY